MKKPEIVICVHGIGRTAWSMWRPVMEAALQGYRILSWDYPSRRGTTCDHAALLAQFLRERNITPSDTVHFITHSLGGLVVTAYLQRSDAIKTGRAVMIAPPLGGSAIVDEGIKWPGFREFFGPAINELQTTTPATPTNAPHHEIAIIAGNKGQWPWSYLFIGEPNDGKVSVASTRVMNSKEHVTLPYDHTGIIMRRDVIDRAMRFIKTGSMA
jgi:pimeloyl-ACP methyl ester carboxylesterase